ncbi:MAG: glycoside hydrolase family 2 protein, partial [Devosia sp.]
MRSLTSFNTGWVFEDGTAVTLPHTAVELPFSYFDERAYQREFTYRKLFDADPAWGDDEVSVLFEGAMANARVSLNGVEIAAHTDGYTPFEARLTGRLRPGRNELVVVIDGSENPEIPPFGGRIDYLTYAGIYRDVWLRRTAPVFVGNVKVETPDALSERKTVTARATLRNPQNQPFAGQLTATITDPAGRVIATQAQPAAAEVSFRFEGLAGIALWDLRTPNLYTLTLSLGDTDALATSFGFRTAEFTPEGFRLNGRPLKLRGLNRHQSFPYAGYALGRAAQERDAEILKHELHVNMVRTS